MYVFASAGSSTEEIFTESDVNDEAMADDPAMDEPNSTFCHAGSMESSPNPDARSKQPTIKKNKTRRGIKRSTNLSNGNKKSPNLSIIGQNASGLL